MRLYFFIFLFGFTYMSFAQKKSSKLRTAKYAGIFGYGSNPEKGPVGQIIVYPETDTTLLFYFEANRGAPSYNMGSLNGRLRMYADTAVYFDKIYEGDAGRKIRFRFSKGLVQLISDTEYDDCGFGHGVYAHGIYYQTSEKIPLSYRNLENTEIFFKDKPE